MLPERWLDYTGLDLVAIALDSFGKMTADARRALVEWVECGGTLVVYKVGKPAGESEELEKLLELQSRAAVTSEWIAFNTKTRPDWDIRSFRLGQPTDAKYGTGF
jgi:hypothetical protein